MHAREECERWDTARLEDRPRESLARDVWHETNRTTPLDNVIDVHMMRLRRKLDGEGASGVIHTIRGAGFMLRQGEP